MDGRGNRLTTTVFAYLREGAVYRDQDSFEAGDRLGLYSVVFGSTGNFIETEKIGGKKYKSLWIWSDEEIEKKRNYGIVPLIQIN